MNTALTPDDKAYLAELAADVIDHGNAEGNLFDELRAAHERRQTFAREMRDGHTPRAKMARKVMALHIHARTQYADSINRCLHDCAEVAA